MRAVIVRAGTRRSRVRCDGAAPAGADSETRRPDDAGMATAELAVCLPVLVLVLAFAVSVLGVGSAQTRALDAAREAARAAARGDRVAAMSLAQSLAPGASVTFVDGHGEVTATVRLDHHLLVSWLPSVTVTERAVAAAEPTAPP